MRWRQLAPASLRDFACHGLQHFVLGVCRDGLVNHPRGFQDVTLGQCYAHQHAPGVDELGILANGLAESVLGCSEVAHRQGHAAQDKMRLGKVRAGEE